ncbi:MAG TPA: VOC family protein [Acetobacteraceae bacterium]|jgi:hypothetical protein|nr:VOC family protein [Acetobacteraceae bacterium]
MSASRFVWYELLTRDVDAATAFYGPLLGWQAQDFPGGEGRYVTVSVDGRGVGGVMALPEGMSKPFWLGYIGTSDIGGSVRRFTDAGGVVHREPWEIPGVGQLALVADPQGAGIAFFQSAENRTSEAFDQNRPGHGNWHELHTTDPEAAAQFYAGQFGWTLGAAMPMGAMGTYQIFEADGTQLGGIMRAQGPMPPMWAYYYFGVPSSRAAAARIAESGGTVLNGPQEVPGGAMIVQARDPQGAMFAVVGPA